MDESVDGEIEKTFKVPFRILEDGDGTAANPGSRIKSRFILIPNAFESVLDDIIMVLSVDKKFLHYFISKIPIISKIYVCSSSR